MWGQVPAAGPQALVAALRQGGYVLVMRHANAPAALPARHDGAMGNTARERQLSEAGLRGATEMGARDARPRCSHRGGVRRARRSAGAKPRRNWAWGSPEWSSGSARGPRRCRSCSGTGARAPGAGVRGAFARDERALHHAQPQHRRRVSREKPAVAEGEVFVVRPAGRDGTVVGRITIDQWPQLVAR